MPSIRLLGGLALLLATFERDDPVLPRNSPTRGMVRGAPGQVESWSSSASDSVFARLDSIFHTYTVGTGPGCSLGVYRGGKVAYARGYGHATAGTDRLITSSTAFEAMSVSKQFTAAAIALLAQDGKLKLDDPVRRWLPELNPSVDTLRPLTIRHLVQHTSGLRDLNLLFTLAGRTPSPLRLDSILAVVARQRSLDANPGERFAYDNTNYSLLALIVERAAGEPLATFASRRIFRPLGMRSTRFGQPLDVRSPPPDVAVGHFPRTTAGRSERDANAALAPSNTEYAFSVLPYENIGPYGLLITVEDLARWEFALANGRVGNSATTALLQTSGRLADGTPLSYAFGLATEPYRGLRMIQHTGSGAGYRSTFMRFPDAGVAFAVLCNVSTAPSYDMAIRAAEVVLGDRMTPRQAETSSAPPPQAATQPAVETAAAVTIPDSVLRGMEGTYWSGPFAKVRRVAVRDGQLSLFTGAVPVPMRPTGRTQDGAWTFVVIEAPQVAWAFVRRTDSSPYQAKRVTRGQPDETYEQRQPWIPDSAALREFVGEYVSTELDARWSIALSGDQLTQSAAGNPPTVIAPAVADVFRATPMVIEMHRSASRAVDGLFVTVPGARRIAFVKCGREGCANVR